MERESDSPLAETKKESNGEFLVRVLKPAGCFLVLLVFVLYLVFCFTYRSAPPVEPEASAAPTAGVTEQKAAPM